MTGDMQKLDNHCARKSDQGAKGGNGTVQDLGSTCLCDRLLPRNELLPYYSQIIKFSIWRFSIAAAERLSRTAFCTWSHSSRLLSIVLYCSGLLDHNGDLNRLKME